MCAALVDKLSLNHIFLCGGIGHWFWKHLVGITPAAPGFATVTIAPRIHDTVGPRSVGGQFLSPKGTIASSWRISGGHSADTTVKLSVRLPVGVGGATIVVVPKPTKAGQTAATASITLGGHMIWDGAKLLGAPAGILSAQDGRDGVAFTTISGVFEFVSSVAESKV